MNKHTIYIITDSNRSYLEVGQCIDLALKVQEIKDASTNLFSNTPKLCNIVYVEHFENLELAEKRTSQLQQFTHMQRERLVRMKNPNWLNLSPLTNRIPNRAAWAPATSH